MANQSSKPAARQLGELLKQKEEPFVLEILPFGKRVFEEEEVITGITQVWLPWKPRIPMIKMERLVPLQSRIDFPPLAAQPCIIHAQTVTDELSMINKAAADSKFQWIPRQKNLFLGGLIMEDSILLLLQAALDKPSCVRELQEAGKSNSLPFSTSNRVLQKAKKLKEDERKVCLGCSSQEWNDYERQKEVGLYLETPLKMKL
ncbi:hypothetical protein F3Y22_tig00110895pilonHSYRG00198 [Hibiscus syriacus]|uniref:Uncharacterized protein n=1 Tax=Hibiscus syriacus TaxID=106335 RepID=A0A6A2ZFQ0_HIBSY|nr:hypothetical protein F3Y22_tig00110895pilonHSYRG00198 [Hibiscus syriacus]